MLYIVTAHVRRTPQQPNRIYELTGVAKDIVDEGEQLSGGLAWSGSSRKVIIVVVGR